MKPKLPKKKKKNSKFKIDWYLSNSARSVELQDDSDYGSFDEPGAGAREYVEDSTASDPRLGSSPVSPSKYRPMPTSLAGSRPPLSPLEKPLEIRSCFTRRSRFKQR